VSEFEFVSVLLAFGLQPWWEDRLEKAEEGRLPTSVLAEFRSNEIAPDSAIAFQEAVQTTDSLAARGVAKQSREGRMIEAQYCEIYFEVWAPFLRANASIPQIANAIKLTRGTDRPYLGLPAPVLPEMVDHRALLRGRDPQTLLMQKRWAQNDILNQCREIGTFLETTDADLVASIEPLLPPEEGE
jgi:hypothetical protein